MEKADTLLEIAVAGIEGRKCPRPPRNVSTVRRMDTGHVIVHSKDRIRRRINIKDGRTTIRMHQGMRRAAARINNEETTRTSNEEAACISDEETARITNEHGGAKTWLSPKIQ